MLLCEAVGQERFADQVKIYATDIDEDALAAARTGYAADALETVPRELVTRYFDLQAGRHVFKPSLRRAIIFGRHDLLQDAPISRVDLLLCRNTLMYFTAETQARILARFHYALRDDGYLFLGRAEMLLTHADLFKPIELRHRVFQKVPQVQVRERLALVAQAGNPEVAEMLGNQVQLRALAGEQLPVAELVLDERDHLMSANHLARASFRLTEIDIGKAFRDLEVSYHPVELRSPLSRATSERQPVVVGDVEHRLPDGGVILFDVHVIPLLDDRKRVVGTSITFRDVTELRKMQSELDRVRHEVETANEELQSSYEELETTNEELQSTVEELETTNEELQSSNEELETMNEELESTNTELQTINSDLRQRTDQVDRLNTFLDAILTSLHVGIAVLDKGLKVLMWNARSYDLWGVRDDEAIGKPFLTLDIGLPFEIVEAMIREVQEGSRPVLKVVDAVNRRGRSIKCRIAITPLSAVNMSAEGALVVMEEMSGRQPESG
jgi:two-component system CheB/CheR fusion protein